MINWLPLFTAVAWVDFAVIVLSKFIPLTSALNTWYKDFGLVAVGSDILIIVLGIALAQLVFPGLSSWSLVSVAVAIQLVHDVLFYILVIRGVPDGQNSIIDLFKRYASEGSWKILLADAGMVAGSVLLMEALDNNLSDDQVGFLGVLAVYSLLYIIYTK
jgi:hypothetical protein